MSVAIRTLLVALIGVGCATGGNGSGDDVQKIDASIHDGPHLAIDAKVYLDASHPPPDAKVFLDAPVVTIDASTSGGSCASNSDCTTTGECCFAVVCVPGTAVGSFCFPM